VYKRVDNVWKQKWLREESGGFVRGKMALAQDFESGD
jgi:hypothetical protein